MSMSADDLSSPRGDSVKFTSVGDAVVGTVAYIGPWQPRVNKFNGKTEETFKLVLETDDGARAVYPVKGSQLAEAIGDALRAAGAPTLEVGGKLGVQLTELRDTGKPQPMKVHEAKYAAPAAARPTMSASELF